MSVGRRFRTSLAVLLLLGLIILLAAACGRPRPDVALLPIPTPGAEKSYPPIEFPNDEAPHDTLTEWWYYTGRLETEDGRLFGFEMVIFQTVRGDYPVVYLSHFAVTDPARGRFAHDSRVSYGSQIGGEAGFDLQVAEWRMQGALGQDQISASMADYAIDLSLRALKPPVLHDQDGLVSFGIAGDSYYYSRTRMAVEGTLVDHGVLRKVTGQAWFDKQWGDFLVLGDGGWDWFSTQLDDGSELMLNHLRDAENRVVGVWGTYVDPSGAFRPLNREDFTITPTGSWTSPRSGGTYPMGWSVTLRQPAYRLELLAVLDDQELYSEGLGPTYWEGAVDIQGSRDGVPVTGFGYVEMTGYADR